MNISKIILFDIANGNGIRVSLFVSGCKFHCPGCFNEVAQDFKHGIKYTKDIQNQILERIARDEYSGLSILGGDPLWQTIEDMQELIQLCDEVHRLGKDVWIWSGFTWEELQKSTTSEEFARKVLINNCDYFVDGRFELSKRDLSLPWRGSLNQRVIDVKKSTKNFIVLRKDLEI